MVKVKLISSSTVGVPDLASFSARVCYQAEEPEMGKLLDVEKALFETAHHTTLQHSFFAFYVEGIAVSDVTLGLHLANPFYNTSQRSGRFCAAMFVCPDYEMIGQYIKTYWPELREEQSSLALDFIKSGIEIYQTNLPRVTKAVKELIKKERPKVTEKYIEQNAPKFAQEQLRNFIPTIFPTALVYTINFSALVALYRSACTPVLRSVTQKMADLVLEKHPTFGYAFKRTEFRDYEIPRPSKNNAVLGKPEVSVYSLGNESKYVVPSPEDVHPVDLLRFHPRFMNNNVEEIKTRVCVSLATMGQDQRHRTIDRSEVSFAGSFYLPPVPRLLLMEEEAMEILRQWKKLYKSLPSTLVQGLAPYGIMVRYDKSASYNAATHELGKRLCWCAQEEIYHLALGLRKEIVRRSNGESPLLKMFPPACVRSGICGEGGRYCGRDMKKDCFVNRKI